MKSDWILRLYLILSGVIFLLVGLMHLFRLIGRVPVVVGGTPLPMLLSYAGLPVAIGCAVWAFWLLRQRG